MGGEESNRFPFHLPTPSFPASPEYSLNRSRRRLLALRLRPRILGSRMDSAAAGSEAAANGGIDGSADPCSSGAAGGNRLSVHQIAGGGKGPLFFPPTLWPCD